MGKKNKQNSRKGQITAFIILGILILAGASFYILYKIRQSEQRPVIGPIIEDTPLEAQPIKKYVEDCVREIGIKAVKMAGKHGGYPDPLDQGVSQKTFLPSLFEPTKGDGVSIDDTPDDFVPYWYYLEGEPNCFECNIRSNAVGIVELENQLNRYVSAHLEDCLGGMEEIKSTGFEVNSVGEITTFSKISDKDIGLLVKYPIKFTKNGHDLSLDSFYVNLDINLTRTLELAWIISSTEAGYSSIEQITKNLISIYSGLDYSKLPPIATTDTSEVEYSWNKVMVRQQIMEILENHIPLITVNNTKNARPVNFANADEYQRNLYSQFITAFDVINSSRYKDLDVTFYYLSWPIYLGINPSEGEMVRGYKDSQRFPNGLSPNDEDTSYEFFYDLSYPIIVTIRDNSAFSNEPIPGYTFTFALESNLKNNKDMAQWQKGEGTMATWDYSLINIGLADDAPRTYQDNQNVTHSIRNQTRSLFCNREQRIAGNLTISTRDRNDGSPLEGVRVSFGCADYKECDMGMTRIDASGVALLSTAFPVCIGSGYLIFEKDGYQKTAKLDIEARVGEPRDLGDTYLEPIRVLNMTLKKLYFNGSFWPMNFTENESLIFNIRKTDNDPLEDPLSQFMMIGPGDNFSKSINLVPGSYEVEAKLMDSTGAVIEKECQHICKIKPSWCEPFCENDYDMDIIERKGVDIMSSFRAAVGAGWIFGGYGALGAWGCSRDRDCVKSVIKGYCSDENYVDILYEDRIPDENISINPANTGAIYIGNETGYLRVGKAKINNFGTLELYVIAIDPPACINDMVNTGKLKDYYIQYINYLQPVYK